MSRSVLLRQADPAVGRANAIVTVALTSFVIFSFVFIPGCGCSSSRPDGSDGVNGAVRSLDGVRFFAYQIQDQSSGENTRKLADSHYDLLVIDQVRSLKGEEDYDSRAEVSHLKESPDSAGGNKKVVCYLDVGEAESYRWYWREGWREGNPEWIVSEDPDGWDENYPVKFWREQWKNIMKESLDRIMEDGYDGVYLDWLEVYSFEPVAATAEEEGLDPRRELVDFVRELADHARSRNEGFLFIAQNAAELGDIARYVEVFDAIGQEAVWFDGGGDPDEGGTPGDIGVDPALTDELIEDLEKWQAAGRPVFDIEYAREPGNAEIAYRLGSEKGFRTYVTLRPLDGLTKTPPPGY